jgi:hypothetical protein
VVGDRDAVERAGASRGDDIRVLAEAVVGSPCVDVKV